MSNKQIQGENIAPLTAEDLVKETCPVSEKEADQVTLAMAPNVKAAATIKDYSKNFGDISLSGLILDLGRQVDIMASGDLTRAENLLAAQAHTLDAIFNNLASTAANTNRIDHMEHYMRLALKAQNQCRTTLESLSAMKSPQSIAFVKQANIGNAVQVNNGIRFGEKDEKHEKVPGFGKQTIGDNDDTSMVSGTASPSSRADSELETVGKVYWSSDQRRKG